MTSNTFWSKERTITKRGVLWVGHICDMNCIFCYDKYMAPEKTNWRSFEGTGGVKEQVREFKYKYNNQYVDFMGGEPTIYPHIFELISYCKEIGIKPTCITHGVHLASKEKVKKFKDAGIHDFLISIHAIGEKNNLILDTKLKNTSEKQEQALENLKEANISFRFNVTLIDTNKDQLVSIVELAKKHGCKVINFIMFNTYFEWEKMKNIDFQASYEAISPYLMKALDLCRTYQIEANVRYFPFCHLKGYEEHIYNGFQLPYDHHEWDYNSWYNLNADVPAGADWYMRASETQRERYGYIKGEKCNGCKISKICDGYHPQYSSKYGMDNIQPFLEGELVLKPDYFIDKQLKVQYLD